MGIGLIIKELAEKQNIALPTLAEKMGITKQGLYKILEKEDVNTAIVRQCARIFGVPAGYFFDEAGTGNAIANGNSVAAINSDVSVGASISQQEKIELLERILEEKERTIQILMSHNNNPF